MIEKFFKKIKKLFEVKFLFNLPKKRNILLYDESNSSIFKKIIRRDFNILEIRKKKIYFQIFIRQIFFFDFTFLTYCKNYIEYTSPKIVLSFNDAKPNFYKLKDIFKHITFISIQNGARDEADFKNYFKSKNFACDHFFVINKFYIKEFKKYIKSNYHILGKFSNNIVKVKKKVIYNDFLLISQFENVSKIQNDYYFFFQKLVSSLNLYFSNSNNKLHILLRRKKTLEQKKEIEFYKKIFHFSCVFHKASEWKKSYEILDKFENIIFMHSTLGYEAISRKKKVAIFPPKKSRNTNFWFGWPAPFQKKYNFFTAKNLSLSEIKRVLNNVHNCSQANWEKKHYSAIKDQLPINKNNLKLKKVIFNSL